MKKSIQLLFHCNLLQENCGDCNLFPADSSNADYIATLHVNWELLPPGNLENNINFLLAHYLLTAQYFLRMLDMEMQYTFGLPDPLP